VIEIVTDVLFVESVTSVAVSVTFAPDGAVEGAVYVIGTLFALDDAEIVPQVGAQLPPACVNVHVTVGVPAESLIIDGVKDCVPLTLTLAPFGETETEIGAVAVVSVTTADADLVGSVTDVAVIVMGVEEPPPAEPLKTTIAAYPLPATSVVIVAL
jgi:hypothetical protein